MSRHRWLRGKALHTLIALNGIQVGDELRVKLNDHAHQSFMNDERVCAEARKRVLKVTDVYMLDRELTGYPPCMQKGQLWITGSFQPTLYSNNWGFCVHEVVAWRRPR